MCGHGPLREDDGLRDTFLSQVLEFLDTALPKDTCQGQTQNRMLEHRPCQALHPVLFQLAGGGQWGVKASCVPVGLWGLPKVKLLPQPLTPTPPLFPACCLPRSSQSASLGGQLPEPGAFHRGSPSRTGFAFQVSGTWHRAAKGPKPPCKHPSLARGHDPPTHPAFWALNPCPPAWFGQDNAPRNEQGRMVI